MRERLARAVVCLTVLLAGGLAAGQQAVPLDFARAHWIWAPAAARTAAFRKSLDLTGPAAFARLLITADARYEVAVNGAVIGRDDDWSAPEQYDLTPYLRAGANALAIRVEAGQQPGLLVALRLVDRDGRLLDLVSDSAWRVAVEPGAEWSSANLDASAWPEAVEVAPYGAPPWGRLTRVSAEETQLALAEVDVVIPAETAEHGQPSRFAGEYATPELAGRYASFVGFDPATGRFRRGGQTAALLFVRYQQPGGLTSPLRFDFDQFDADLRTLAANHLQIALGGFGWADLLTPDGRWKPVVKQPRGTNLPEFRYAYQVVSHALDMIQARGLYALALLDYRQPLPSGTVPDAYLDKLLLAPQLWRAVVEGQAKIAAHFRERPVLLGYALATDALPPPPRVDEPLARAAFTDYLSRRYGDVAGLQAAWGVSVGWASLADVPGPRPSLEGPAGVDYRRLLAETSVTRLNDWADRLREADPRHLLLLGVPGGCLTGWPLATLRFDALGAFGLADGQVEASGLMPGHALATVAAYRNLPGSTIQAVLSGGFGAGRKGGHATRILRQGWAATLAEGGAGMLCATPWDELVGRSAGGSGDAVGVRQLGELVAATRANFGEELPEALILANGAMTLGGEGETNARAVARTAEALDRLGLRYEIAELGDVGRSEERYRVALDGYRVVLLPALGRLPEDAVFERLSDWLTAAPQRLLVLSAWDGRNAHGRGTPPSNRLLRLTGGARSPREPQVGLGRSLWLESPLAAGTAGNRLAWPTGWQPRGLTLPADGARPVGWLGEAGPGQGLPLAAWQAHDRSAALTLGLDLGYAPGDPLLADAGTLATLLTGALRSMGLTIGEPTGVAVARSTDGRTALLRERLGDSTTAIWRSTGTAPLAWVGAVTEVAGDLTTVKVPLAPYQLTVLRAVGEIVGGDSGATVRVNEVGGQTVLSGVGPAGLTVRLWAEPGADYTYQTSGRPAVEVRADTAGLVDVPLGAGTVQVTSRPAPTPARGGGQAPADYMVVGDYYRQRGEFGRALAEFERLIERHAGTPVGELARQRQAALLAECGAVVLVNYSRYPLSVRYAGPSSTEAILPPGQQQTFLLYAGEYREFKSLPATAPGGEPKPETLTVGKGQTALREFGILAEGQQLDPRYNVRQKLSETERTQLLTAAGGQLPAAATGAAGAPAGGQFVDVEARAPGIEVKIDVVARPKKEPVLPTPLRIRNRMPYKVQITLINYVAGIAPTRVVKEIPPGRRLDLVAGDIGQSDIVGLFPHNNQDFPILQISNDGIPRDIDIREPKPGELDAK